MSVAWTLRYTPPTGSPVEQSLADWGLANVEIRRQNLATGQLSFDALGRAVDAPRLFAPWTTLQLYRTENGTKSLWWQGIVLPAAASGSSSAESQHYAAADLFWYLENLTMRQLWRVADQLGGLTTAELTSLVLFADIDGNAISAGQQAAAAIAFAAACGAPLAPGAIDLPVTPPFDEVRDLQCLEVLHRCHRWAPDTVGWIDLALTPPQIHLRQRAYLDPITLPLTAASNLTIRPRDDLQVPAVAILYTYYATYGAGGALFADQSSDIYPVGKTGKEFRAITVTINLEGGTGSALQQEVRTMTLPDDWQTNEAFWFAFIPSLADSRVGNITISNAKRSHTGPGPLPRILTGGQIAPWMMTGSAQVKVETETFEADITFDFADTDGTGKTITATEHYSFTLTMTDACPDSSPHVYKRIEGYTAKEPMPFGLAQAFYTALATLHYEGRFTIEEAECSGQITVGQALNISGGDPAWTAMNALVSEVTESLDTGRTTVSFGPPKHLTPADVTELLRAARNRRFTGQFNGRASGLAASNPEGEELPTDGVRLSASHHAGVHAKHVVAKVGDTAITNDAATGTTVWEEN